MKLRYLAISVCTLLGNNIEASAQDAAPFTVNWSTLDGGGGASSGGGFSLNGTFGQPDAGVMNGGSFSIAGGFWGEEVPELRITRFGRNADGTFTIEWVGGGTLQTAPAVTGPWQDVPGAASPYTLTPTAPMLFLRIRL